MPGAPSNVLYPMVLLIGLLLLPSHLQRQSSGSFDFVLVLHVRICITLFRWGNSSQWWNEAKLCEALVKLSPKFLVVICPFENWVRREPLSFSLYHWHLTLRQSGTSINRIVSLQSIIKTDNRHVLLSC